MVVENCENEYIGKFDVSNEELTLIKKELKKMVYDEYDWLIQLSDCLADVEGILDIEERMRDVRKRYGFYPQDKWDSNLRLMHYFEKKMNRDIYLVCEKETFAPVSPLLCGQVQEDDKITVRKVESLKEVQLSIFDM